jgi:hypothetical protein
MTTDRTPAELRADLEKTADEIAQRSETVLVRNENALAAFGLSACQTGLRAVAQLAEEQAKTARLLTSVEAAILNIQHDRIGAAIAGLRVARDLTRGEA